MTNGQSPPPEPRRHSRWAWRIGSLAGISLYIHATFVVLLVWIALSHFAAGHDLSVALQGLLLVVSVFAVVVLHELGHALVARRFGVSTRDITLYPIGGIAHLERMPENPRQELLVAIAGPAVNAVLALAIYLGLVLTGSATRGDPLTIGGAFALQLMWINITLGAFNLLPAFPMDGGRVLRAILGFWMTRHRATLVAVRLARGLALAMGIAGILWNPLLAVIAVFVWIAAGQELAVDQVKTVLRGISVGDAMVTDIDTLAPDTELDTAASQLVTGFQHDFPVVEGERVVGVLTRDDVMRGLTEHRAGLTVADVMHRQYPTAHASDDLESVLDRLVRDGSPAVVLHDDRIVGLLDPEHINALLAVRGGMLAKY
jgi:Zn-dependent protease/CBS domain-containing protein